MGPLTGLKVLDLSRILAGPWATQVLADFGAEIWKIEKPRDGDDTRHWGDPVSSVAKPENLNASGKSDLPDCDLTSAYFLSANRGKNSLCVDIRTKQGQQIIKKLVEKADIVVENFKVGNLKKYQLDYQSLREVNASIIYCSITGFGQTGPFADQPGYDAMIQASAGLMSLTGEEDGTPQKVGVAVSDLMTGMYAVSALLSAVYHRQKTGVGQYIDLALYDTQISWLANQGMSYLISGKEPERNSSAHPSIAPYQPVSAKDGTFMLAVGNDIQFERCCRVVGKSELVNDKRFKTNNKRSRNRNLLIDKLNKQFATHPVQHWLTLLTEAEVPCGPINNLKQAFEHPQVKARETLFTLKHSQLGELIQVANPVKFSQTPVSYTKSAPVLGEDTKAILKQELNFDESEICELMRQGVIDY